MSTLRSFFTRSLTTPDADATAATLACYGTALLVLVCGFTAIGLLGQEMAGTFLTILGVLAVSLLFVLLGQLTEIQQRLKKIEDKKP